MFSLSWAEVTVLCGDELKQGGTLHGKERGDFTWTFPHCTWNSTGSRKIFVIFYIIVFNRENIENGLLEK